MSTEFIGPLAPCENEDGPGPCYWNAQEMGNGIGQSFIIDIDGTFHNSPNCAEGEGWFLDPAVLTEGVAGWFCSPTTLPEPLPLDIEQPVGIPNTETGTSTAQPVEYDELAYTGPLEVTALGIIGVTVIIAGFMLRRKF